KAAMLRNLNRRIFAQSLLAGVPAGEAPGASRRLQIGYTCITWGAFPRGAEASAALEPAVKDIAALGFHGFETFPEILEDWDSRGALQTLIERNKLPLTSGYIRTNLTDPTAAKDNLAQVTRLAKIIKKYGGTFGVLAPNSIKREGYDFHAHRARIIS